MNQFQKTACASILFVFLFGTFCSGADATDFDPWTRLNESQFCNRPSRDEIRSFSSICVGTHRRA